MPTAEIPKMYDIPKFDPIVTFKDQTVIYARAGYNEVEDSIWIWPSDAMTIPEAVTIFSDTSKTEQIRIDYTSLSYDVYDGYTDLAAVTATSPGKLSIQMKKPKESV